MRRHIVIAGLALLAGLSVAGCSLFDDSDERCDRFYAEWQEADDRLDQATADGTFSMELSNEAGDLFTRYETECG